MPTHPYLDKDFKKKLDAVKFPGEYQWALDRAKEQEDYPDNNPKQAMGAKKCPLHLVPPALMIAAADGMKNGGDKYGPYNFRDSKISASVYVGAFLRHLFAYWDGEDYAQDSGILHVNHLASGLAVMLDAINSGTFVDDRPAKGGAPEMLAKWEEDIAKEELKVTIPREALEELHPGAYFLKPEAMIKEK